MTHDYSHQGQEHRCIVYVCPQKGHLLSGNHLMLHYWNICPLFKLRNTSVSTLLYPHTEGQFECVQLINVQNVCTSSSSGHQMFLKHVNYLALFAVQHPLLCCSEGSLRLSSPIWCCHLQAQPGKAGALLTTSPVCQAFATQTEEYEALKLNHSRTFSWV